MLTVSWGDESEIRGRVTETYCRKCGRYLRIYFIDYLEENLLNIDDIIKEGIDKHSDRLLNEINELEEIKKRELYEVEKDDESFYVEFLEYDFTEVGETKEKSIETALDEFHELIDDEIALKKEEYEKRKNSNYLIINEKKSDYDPLSKINCSECGEEMHMFINSDVPCPKCGGHILATNTVFYD